MGTSAPRVAAAFAATLLLAVATSGATANRLSLSNQTFRIVWRALAFENNGSAEPVECIVTMEGSFHSRTMVKTRAALIGYVTRARVERVCFNGEGWAYNGVSVSLGTTVTENTLPWPLKYEGFAGTLPNIEAFFFGIQGITIGLRASGILWGGCLAIFGRPEDISAGTAWIGANGLITGYSFEPTAELRLRRGLAGCPMTVRIHQNEAEHARYTQLGTTTTVTLTLI